MVSIARRFLLLIICLASYQLAQATVQCLNSFKGSLLKEDGQFKLSAQDFNTLRDSGASWLKNTAHATRDKTCYVNINALAVWCLASGSKPIINKGCYESGDKEAVAFSADVYKDSRSENYSIAQLRQKSLRGVKVNLGSFSKLFSKYQVDK